VKAQQLSVLYRVSGVSMPKTKVKRLFGEDAVVAR
jgi:hypothetical protein